METFPVSHLLKQKGYDVITIGPTATVFEAIRTMVDHNVGSILVMEEDAIVGIFTERDYLRRIALEGRTSSTTKVHEVMTTEVRTVRPNRTIGECLSLMTKHKCRHLPVCTREGELQGIVSIGDCVKHISTQAKEEVETLKSYIAGGYPA